MARSANVSATTPAGSTGRTAMRALTIATTLLLIATGVAPALAQTGTWISHGPEGGSISAIAVDPRAPNTVYAGTLGLGIFKSVDGGRTWEPSSSGLTNRTVRALVIDPSDSRILYAGTIDGVFRSLDAGASWTSAGLPTDIRALAIDPSSLTVYAGTGSGVFRSPTGGPPWTSILSGQNQSDI